MSITRLGVSGPMAAYLAFDDKAEADVILLDIGATTIEAMHSRSIVSLASLRTSAALRELGIENITSSRTSTSLVSARSLAAVEE